MDESEDSQLEAAIRASLADAEKKDKKTASGATGKETSKGGAVKGRQAAKESETTESDEGGSDTEEELETFSSSGDEGEEEEVEVIEEGKEGRSAGQALAVEKKVSADSKTIGKAKSVEAEKAGQDDSLNLNSSHESAPDEANDDLNTTPREETTGADRWRQYCVTDGENAAKTKIIFRLPDGARQQVELVAEAPLLALTLFVNDQGFPNERFELVTNFPRKKLSYMDGDSSLKSIGIIGQETVFVQEREIPLAG